MLSSTTTRRAEAGVQHALMSIMASLACMSCIASSLSAAAAPAVSWGAVWVAGVLTARPAVVEAMAVNLCSAENNGNVC